MAAAVVIALALAVAVAVAGVSSLASTASSTNVVPCGQDVGAGCARTTFPPEVVTRVWSGRGDAVIVPVTCVGVADVVEEPAVAEGVGSRGAAPVLCSADVPGVGA